MHYKIPNRKSCPSDDCRWGGEMIAASSYHPGGLNVVCMEGFVRFVKTTFNYQAWYAWATQAGSETISADRL